MQLLVLVSLEHAHFQQVVQLADALKHVVTVLDVEDVPDSKQVLKRQHLEYQQDYTGHSGFLNADGLQLFVPRGLLAEVVLYSNVILQIIVDHQAVPKLDDDQSIFENGD